jgi:hypothetical protein
MPSGYLAGPMFRSIPFWIGATFLLAALAIVPLMLNDQQAFAAVDARIKAEAALVDRMEHRTKGRRAVRLEAAIF